VEAVLPAIKQLIVTFVDKWAMYTAIIWTIISCFIGIVFVRVDLGIALPLMTLFMFFGACWGLFAMLIVFRKMNPKLNEQIFKVCIGFFYCFGLIGCVILLFSGIFNWSNQTGYGAITSAIFPLGASLGASKMFKYISVERVPRV
jgi:hypothetical protein